ncbi:MAG: DMT family transporter [candidate division WOR-3 bacterium]
MASIIYAFYVVVAKRFSLQIEPIHYTFSTNFVSTFIALAFLSLFFKFQPDIVPSLSIIWLAVFPSTLGYIFYFYGLKFKGAVSSSVIILSTIIFGTVLSIVILGESLSALETFGLFLAK